MNRKRRTRTRTRTSSSILTLPCVPPAPSSISEGSIALHPPAPKSDKRGEEEEEEEEEQQQQQQQQQQKEQEEAVKEARGGGEEGGTTTGTDSRGAGRAGGVPGAWFLHAHQLSHVTSPPASPKFPCSSCSFHSPAIRQM